MRLGAETNASSRPSTPTQSKPNVSSISHTEKEQIAMQWLRATFEPVVGAPSIEQNVLYRQYTAGCARNGPKQVLGIVQFFSCVRYNFAFDLYNFTRLKCLILTNVEQRSGRMSDHFGNKLAVPSSSILKGCLPRTRVLQLLLRAFQLQQMLQYVLLRILRLL